MEATRSKPAGMRSTRSSRRSPSGRRSTSRTARSGWACREGSALAAPVVLETVRATLRRHAMLTGGEHVVIGVSGGADSTALLSVLTSLTSAYRLRLSALHVDHRLRPESWRGREHLEGLRPPPRRPARAGDLPAGLAGAAREPRQAVDTLERVAGDALGRLATIDGDALVLARSALAGLPPLVAADVLRQGAVRLGHRGPLRAWAHRGLRRMLAAPSPRRPFRLDGVTFDVSGDLVRIGVAAPVHLRRRVLNVPGVTLLSEIGLRIEARHIGAAGYVLPRDRGCVAFDADALAMPLHVRGRERGDRFRPFSERGERRLKTFLIDAKVPRWDRDRLPLVESGREIVWVGGLRRGSQAPVTPATRDIVELTVKSLAD